jgi:hypothetical protein
MPLVVPTPAPSARTVAIPSSDHPSNINIFKFLTILLLVILFRKWADLRHSSSFTVLGSFPK